MRIPVISGLIWRTKRLLKKDPNRFLKKVSGVVHIGANEGQERHTYAKHGLRVIWVEPIPEVFGKLRANIAEMPNQQAFQYLVTDQDDREYTFHVSNNDGQSSSILDLKDHKDIWPEVAYQSEIKLRGITFGRLIEREKIDLQGYEALIMDTQGSELMILKGAVPVLGHFQFIKIEVPDFESYEGCCTLKEVALFFAQNGFKEFSRKRFAHDNNGKSYYDVVYRNRGWKPKK